MSRLPAVPMTAVFAPPLLMVNAVRPTLDRFSVLAPRLRVPVSCAVPPVWLIVPRPAAVKLSSRLSVPPDRLMVPAALVQLPVPL